MAIAFPGESAEYRAARNHLLQQEIELRRATEAVAAARRAGLATAAHLVLGRVDLQSRLPR
jgi:predicted dithiol-disulfide oxidoreductase (DUF899 family)